MVAEADKQAAKLEADAAKKAEKAGQDGEKASVAVLKAAEKDAAALTRASKGAITKVAERAWPGCSRASGSYAQAICPRRTRHPNPYPGGAGRQSGRARTLKRNEAAQMWYELVLSHRRRGLRWRVLVVGSLAVEMIVWPLARSGTVQHAACSRSTARQVEREHTHARG